jgi:hypothetical protein
VEQRNAAIKLGSSAHEKDQAGGMLGGMIKAAKDAVLKSEIKPIKPHEAEHALQQIHQDLHDAKTPADLHAATRKAQELQGRMEASADAHFPAHLQHQVTAMRDRAEKANAAVGKLHAMSNTLQHGTAQERATLTAHLLSHPSEFKQTLKAVSGTLKGSELLKHQQDRAARIAEMASPEHLGLELKHDPDLSHYPPGMANDLGALRVIPDKHLQAGIDAVGKDMLAKSSDAHDPLKAFSDVFGGVGRPADPLSLANVEKTPGLGQIIAPMQASKDPLVAGAVQDVARRWNQDAMLKNLAANKHGAPADPKANATNTYQGFQQEMSTLAAKTGMGGPIVDSMDAATRSVASTIAGDPAIDLHAVQQNPAYGQIMAQYQHDPVLEGEIGAKVKDMIGQDVRERMDGKKKEDGVKKGMDEVKSDLTTLAENTGLGDAIAANAEAAINDNHKAIHDASERGKGLLDHLSDGFNSLVGDFAKGISFGFKELGKIHSMAFDAVGLHGIAKFDREFTAGVGDGLAGTVTGLGQMVTHPLATAKGLGGMVTHPERLADAGKAMWNEAMKGGLAHGLGYGVAMIAPAILTDGGSLGGTLSGVAAKGVAELGAREIPVLSNVASKLGDVGAIGAKGFAVFKGAMHGEVDKIVEGVSASSSKEALKAADVGTHSLRDLAKDGVDQIRAGADTLKKLAKADDKGAAIKEFTSDKARTIRRSYLKGKEDQIKGYKAVRHPKQGAAEFKKALDKGQSKLRAARDAWKHGANVKGGAQAGRRARAEYAIDQLGKGVEAITNTGFFKAGEAVVDKIGTVVNPLGAITEHLPTAKVLEDQIDKRAQGAAKKLDATSQASLATDQDSADEIVAQAKRDTINAV